MAYSNNRLQQQKLKKLSEIIITVDEQGRLWGTIDKMQAHKTGKLHRAFSIFIFNTAGQLLLQQRAASKYHSGTKWSNTCCGHPKIGQQTGNAARTRLQEEMGFECDLNEVFTFRYCETLENGLIENEFDHVFFGVSNLTPIPNPLEVMDFKYITLDDLKLDMQTNPNDYTIWFKICFAQVLIEVENESKKQQFNTDLHTINGDQ